MEGAEAGDREGAPELECPEGTDKVGGDGVGCVVGASAGVLNMEVS